MPDNRQLNIATASEDDISVLTIQKLPPELCAKVLEYLDYKDLLTCMRVSSYFLTIIKNSSYFQFKIELAVAGKVSIGQDGISSIDRLKSLKAYSKAWDELKWNREIRIPMKEGGLWELLGGVLAQSTEDGKLLFYQLPSDYRSIEGKHWSLDLHNIRVNVQDFSMDLSQDLLVLVETPNTNMNVLDRELQYRVHLLTLSSGKPHPQASKGYILSLQLNRQDRASSCNIQIWGNLISILFGGSAAAASALAIWEWKTNKLLADVYANDVDILSATIISESWLLLGVSDEYGEPLIAAFNFKQERRNVQEDDAYFSFRNTIKFRYPPLISGAFLNGIEIRCDPGPFTKTSSTPFSQKTDDFLLVVNITIWVVAEHTFRSMTHFIPSSWIISLIESPRPLFFAASVGYFWSQWASQEKTRLLVTSIGFSNVWTTRPEVTQCAYTTLINYRFEEAPTKQEKALKGVMESARRLRQ